MGPSEEVRPNDDIPAAIGGLRLLGVVLGEMLLRSEFVLGDDSVCLPACGAESEGALPPFFIVELLRDGMLL